MRILMSYDKCVKFLLKKYSGQTLNIFEKIFLKLSCRQLAHIDDADDDNTTHSGLGVEILDDAAYTA